MYAVNSFLGLLLVQNMAWRLEKILLVPLRKTHLDSFNKLSCLQALQREPDRLNFKF